MSAPEPVQDAALAVTWVHRQDATPGCCTCGMRCGTHTGLVIHLATLQADAAFAASLEWAARSIGETQDHPKNAGMSDECYEGVTLAAILIRRWARGER